jgi:hypothetical protein
VYKLTAEGKERFAEMLADAGPQTWEDDGFGIHMTFFSRTPADIRMRILEGRRRRVEERREGLRAALARAGEQIDRYTRELHRLGLDASEREVRWLNELIASEQVQERDPHRSQSNQPKSAQSASPASEAKTQRDPHRPESNQPKSAQSASPASEAKTQLDFPQDR